MAHNIGKMFYVGERPWHHLGTPLKTPIDAERALKEGGLDYTVSLMPLAVKGEPTSAVPQRMAVVRDDRSAGEAGRVLGVVHPNFKLLQNREGVMLFDALFGDGRPVYHTGGFLKQGEVVWLQARLPNPITVCEGDQLDAYLLFSNSHDGSYPIDIRISTVRVVCNNTLNLALKDKTSGRLFRRGHSGSLEVVKEDAAKFFNSVLAAQLAAQAQLVALAAAKCNEDDFKRFLAKVLPVPAPPSTAPVNQAAVRAHATREIKVLASRQQVLNAHLRGYVDPTSPGVRQPPADPTWWGALNSVTAWVDHLQEVDGDRYAHIMFGGGDEMKAKALSEAIAEAAAAAPA